MRKVCSLFILSSFFCFSFPASIDTSLESAVRAYPPGFFTGAEIGLNYLFSNSKTNWKKTFSRLKVQGRSSGVVNGGLAHLEFYPLGFLKFYGGIFPTWRNTDFYMFQCEKTSCRERVDRFTTGSSLALAFKQYFFFGDYSRSKVSQEGNSDNFADEQFTLLAEKNTYIDQAQIALGSNITPKIQLGSIAVYNRASKTNEKNLMLAVFGSYKTGDIGTSLGLGSYYNRFSSTHPTIFVRVKWDFEKGPKLF